MFLQYFAQATVEKKRDYTVYVYDMWKIKEEQYRAMEEKYGGFDEGGHADVFETADIMAIDEGLVDMSTVRVEESQSLHRADDYNDLGVFTGVNWYANYPHQFAGDPRKAAPELGEEILGLNARNLVEVIRKVKEDTLFPQDKRMNKILHENQTTKQVNFVQTAPFLSAQKRDTGKQNHLFCCLIFVQYFVHAFVCLFPSLYREFYRDSGKPRL